MEGKISRERIDHAVSLEYQYDNNKEEQRKALHVFGKYSIDSLDKSKDFEGFNLRSLRDKFYNLGKFDHKAIRVLITEMAVKKKLLDRIKFFLLDRGVEVPDGSSAQDIGEIIISNPDIWKDIPDKLIEAIARAHIEIYEIRQQKFEHNELPSLVKMLDEKFTDAILKGVLPVEMSYWKRILDNTGLNLGDPVFMIDGMHGSFLPKFGVRLMPGLSQKELESTAIHEYLHALSGRLVVKETQQEESGFSKEETSFEHNRVGFQFNGKSIWTSKFRWLNEAVTEDLSIRVRGSENTPSDSYVEERKLLDFICKKMGDGAREQFVKAYFENYNPDEPQVNRIAEWRTLVGMINKKFGSGFLPRLDKFIENQRNGSGNLYHWQTGVKIAVEKWERFGDDFPEYLKQWEKEYREKFTFVVRDILKILKDEEKTKIADLSHGSFNTKFENLWQEKIRFLIPHPSQYELAVIKEMIEGSLRRGRLRLLKA